MKFTNSDSNAGCITCTQFFVSYSSELNRDKSSYRRKASLPLLLEPVGWKSWTNRAQQLGGAWLKCNAYLNRALQCVSAQSCT